MNNPIYVVQCVTWQDKQRDLRLIRDEVFLQEQCVPVVDEWDGKDDEAIHFLIADQLHPIATARVLLETDNNNHPLFHIGRVAVRKPFRNTGIGRRLMSEVIRWCFQQHESAKLYLHAQTARRRFYEAAGFVAQGEEFMDAGIPHIAMWYRAETAE